VTTPSDRALDVVRILVIDDERAIADLVATALRYEGFGVATAGTGRQAIRAMREFEPHLAVLDINLPDIDGFELLPRLRQHGKLPIVYLTARDDVVDRVRGLTVGGDDYVTKPFSLEELVARIRSVLRRTSAASSERLAYADLEIDEASREARRSGDRLGLTPTEYALLRFMVENAGQVLSKRQILDRVWNYDFNGNTNIVETYIRYLRRKVDAGRPPLIQTVRGFGYVLREEQQDP